jgi:tripartite ATP-independent transporter DctM subunit
VSLFLLFALMLTFMALGMSIAVAMIASSLIYLLLNATGPMSLPLAVIPQKLLYGVDSFPLLAIPLFMLAGELMSAGGITNRIVRFGTALVGWITGGLAHVTIVVNMIMAGMSGSAVADAAATGSVLIPAMIKARFPAAFAAAVTAAAATIGPIIPPSIPFVLIGTIAQISIGRLFLGGAIPGVIMGLFLMAVSYWVAKRQGYAVEKRASFPEILASFWDSAPALIMPLIIMVGILSGIATPTEAAVLAVAYALFLSVVVYRKLSLSEVYRICWRMGSATAAIMITIAGATLLGFVATAEQMGPKLIQLFLSWSDNPHLLLLIINMALLFLGWVMEPVPIILLTVSVFFPVLTKIGMDPIHLGVVMTLNLMIGLLTPFVGLNLFVTAAIANVPVIQVARESFIFIAALIAVLFLISYVPELVLWLPNTVMGR